MPYSADIPRLITEPQVQNIRQVPTELLAQQVQEPGSEIARIYNNTNTPQSKFMWSAINKDPVLRMMAKKNPNNIFVLITPRGDRKILIAEPKDIDNNGTLDKIDVTKSGISGFLEGVTVPSGVWKVNMESLINNITHTYTNQIYDIGGITELGQYSTLIETLELAYNDISANGYNSKYAKDTKLFTPMALVDSNGNIARDNSGRIVPQYFDSPQVGIGERGVHDKYGTSSASDQDSNGCGRLEAAVALKMNLKAIQYAITNLKNLRGNLGLPLYEIFIKDMPSKESNLQTQTFDPNNQNLNVALQTEDKQVGSVSTKFGFSS